MPDPNESQSDRQPKQGNDRRQDQLRSPKPQQEQQDERSSDKGDDRQQDRYRNDT